MTASNHKGLDLMAQLVMASSDDLKRTNDAIIESLQRRLDDCEAELAAVRYRMNELLNEPYAPSETAITQAVFYPRKALMVELRRKPEES